MNYHLKLIKSLSYSGIVNATKKNPDVYVDDKATADAAVATGYFELVEETSEEKQDNSQTTGHLDEATLLTYKLEQLKTLATDMGIDTTGLKTKADYAAVIAAVEVTPEPETDENSNEADYGED